MNKRNQSLATTAVVLGVIALGIIGWRLYSKSSQTDNNTKTVKIGYLNITASLPLFIADQKGFLAEEGVKFEAVPVATSNQLVDGIIAGNLDAFIESSAAPVLSAESQSPGMMKIFSASAITREAPFDALLVKEDSTIKNLSDLAGKKIGVFPGSTATNLLKKFLIDKGVDVSKISFLPIPSQNQLTALTQNSIDVLHSYEPTTATALSNGGIKKMHSSVYAEMLEPNPQGVAVVSSKFVSENPELAAKVVKALERGMNFMTENENESRNILTLAPMKLRSDIAQKTVFLYMLPHDKIDKQILQTYSDMLTDLGEIKTKVIVNDLIYQK